MSISVISRVGAHLRRRSSATTCATRSDVNAGRAADALKHRCGLQATKLDHDVFFSHVGRDQANILQRLDPDAAQTDQHDRAPVGVALGADDELQAARAHRFDQRAVEPQLGPM